MAASIQDHFHIFARSTSPTHAQAIAYAKAMAGGEDKPVTAAEGKRSLGGALIKQRLLDGGGAVVKFRDGVWQVMCRTTALKDALLALSGTDCYLCPINHDDGGANLKLTAEAGANGYNVFMVVVDVKPLVFNESTWLVAIQLQEDTI